MAGGADNYRRAIRAAVRGLWNGVLDRAQFEDSMRDAIDNRFYQAFLEGAAECDIAEDEIKTGEWTVLERTISEEFEFIGGFADAIQANDKASGGKLGPLYTRIDLWVKRYNDLRNRAKVLACGDRKLEWIVNSQETCGDCIRLRGQVRRASVWQAADLRPQHPNLECMESAGGVSVCLCELKPTDRPASKGPLPRI